MMWYKNTAPNIIIRIFIVPAKALINDAKKVSRSLPLKKKSTTVTANPTKIPVRTPFQMLNTSNRIMGRKDNKLK